VQADGTGDGGRGAGDGEWVGGERTVCRLVLQRGRAAEQIRQARYDDAAATCDESTGAMAAEEPQGKGR